MAALEGHSCLVTGGGSGIGLGCALRLAADGAAITLCGRTEGRLQGAVERIAAAGGPAPVAYAVADVTDEEQVRAAVEVAAGLTGSLQSVVACAGGSETIGPLLMTDVDRWRATLDTNVTGTFLALKHAAPVMAAGGGGAFVGISSIASSNTHRWFGAYGVAKAAIDHLCRLAADELGTAGIRVNCVRPGLVRTELVEGLLAEPRVVDDYLSCMPVSRVGEPADVAEAVRFLVGPESSWVTGQVLNVDGGHSLRRGPDISSLLEPVFGREALEGRPPASPAP